MEERGGEGVWGGKRKSRGRGGGVVEEGRGGGGGRGGVREGGLLYSLEGT